MDDLKITLIQSDVFWEDSGKNLSGYRKIIVQTEEESDVIILPEMFNTGFTMHPELCAQPMDGPAMQFLAEMSSARNCMIISSILVREKDFYYNRLISMYPDGSFQQYDKRHLFILTDENKVMTGGTKRIICTWKGWKILPLICYDLRFPVWSRNTWENGEYEYDLLVYPSNWPASRSQVFKSLLIARAIENISFVAGVNRVGKDGDGTAHSGESLIVDLRGRIAAMGETDKSCILSVSLSAKELKDFRRSFDIGPGWDHFRIEI
jgi:predicted amidohydrolase